MAASFTVDTQCNYSYAEKFQTLSLSEQLAISVSYTITRALIDFSSISNSYSEQVPIIFIVEIILLPIFFLAVIETYIRNIFKSISCCFIDQTNSLILQQGSVASLCAARDACAALVQNPIKLIFTG